MRLVVEPASGPLRGRITPPGDKSVSHRAAIFGALAEGTTEVIGFLEAEDTLATLSAVQGLGARIERDGALIRITGRPLRAPAAALDFGNSGTGIRLMTGALAGHPDLFGATLTLTGDDSLSRRPMARVAEPLGRMGARITTRNGSAPLVIEPQALTGRCHELEVASAQVKSALLLAGLFATGRTVVVEPQVSRDHSERLLPAFGVELERDGNRVAVAGGQRLHGCRLQVPGDPSSAAFLAAAAFLVPGSRVVLEPVGVNPTRDGFLRVLDRMRAAAVEREALPELAGDEPVARLTVHGGARSHGVDVPEAWVPAAIDEFPLIMALAAVAEGRTRIRGAAELRVKESDRLAVMSAQLRKLGVTVDETADGADVHGGPVAGGRVDAGGDHRIAMSLAVLGLVADAPIEIDGAQWIRTSYPGFVDDFNRIGGTAQWQ